MRSIVSGTLLKYFTSGFTRGVWLLLTVYLLVFLLPPGSWPHTHHDHESHAGDSCQKDPCHVAIYHPGSKNKCDHKSHLTQEQEECLWCRVIPTRQTVPPAIDHIPVLAEFSPCWLPYRTLGSFAFHVAHADRGPPSHIQI